MNNLEQQIAALEQKIQTIDAEREVLFQELTQLNTSRADLDSGWISQKSRNGFLDIILIAVTINTSFRVVNFSLI